MPSPEIWGYRNKIRLRVLRDEDGAVRFVYNEPGEQASFVTVDRCHLVPDRMNDLLARLRELDRGGPFPGASRASRSGRAGPGASRSWPVRPELGRGGGGARRRRSRGLKRELGLVGAIASVYDGKHRRDEALFGRDFIEEIVRGLTFKHRGAVLLPEPTSASSSRVFDDVAAAAAPQAGETVADLYCGLGTFGILLARKAREVFGVESDAGNIAFLKKNLALNGIGNFAVCEGTTEEWLEEVLERQPGVVVVDPPRKGVDPSDRQGSGRRPRAAPHLPLVQSDDAGPGPQGPAPASTTLHEPAPLRLLPPHAPHRDPGRSGRAPIKWGT
ncbi:MAG: methyltransferase [Candidatus Moduliflexus flocculans]|nr:methyltransferase [Candidatus Moduliflexus flocculans]